MTRVRALTTAMALMVLPIITALPTTRTHDLLPAGTDLNDLNNPTTIAIYANVSKVLSLWNEEELATAFDEYDHAFYGNTSSVYAEDYLAMDFDEYDNTSAVAEQRKNRHNHHPHRHHPHHPHRHHPVKPCGDLCQKIAQIRELTEKMNDIVLVFKNLGKCATKLPGVEGPAKSVKDLAAAFKTDKMNGVKTYVEGRVELAMSEVVQQVDLKNMYNLMMEDLVKLKDIKLIKDGLINDDAIEGLIKSGLTTMTKVLDTIPAFKCINDEISLGGQGVKKMIATISALARKIVQKINDAWSTLIGPDGPIMRMVEKTKANMLAKVEGLIQKQLSSELVEMDEKVGKVVTKVCVMRDNALMNFSNALQEFSIVLPGFCYVKNTIANLFADPYTMLSILFEDVLTWVTDKALNWLDDKVFKPLGEQMQYLATTVSGLMNQAVDGLCGLIPEIGGPIAAAITAPLSTVVNKLTLALSEFSLDGAVKNFKAFVYKQVPKLAGAAAWLIAKSIEKMKTDAKALKEDILDSLLQNAKVEKIVDAFKNVMALKEDSKLLGFIGGAVDFLMPIFNWFLKLIVPNLYGAFQGCKANAQQFRDLVDGALCPDPQLPAPKSGTPSMMLLAPPAGDASAAMAPYFNQDLADEHTVLMLSYMDPSSLQMLSDEVQMLSDEVHELQSGKKKRDAVHSEVNEKIVNFLKRQANKWLDLAVKWATRQSVESMDLLEEKWGDTKAFDTMSKLFDTIKLKYNDASITSLKLDRKNKIDNEVGISLDFEVLIGGVEDDGTDKYIAIQQAISKQMGKTNVTMAMNAGTNIKVRVDLGMRIVNPKKYPDDFAQRPEGKLLGGCLLGLIVDDADLKMQLKLRPPHVEFDFQRPPSALYNAGLSKAKNPVLEALESQANDVTQVAMGKLFNDDGMLAKALRTQTAKIASKIAERFADKTARAFCVKLPKEKTDKEIVQALMVREEKVGDRFKKLVSNIDDKLGISNLVTEAMPAIKHYVSQGVNCVSNLIGNSQCEIGLHEDHEQKLLDLIKEKVNDKVKKFTDNLSDVMESSDMLKKLEPNIKQVVLDFMDDLDLKFTLDKLETIGGTKITMGGGNGIGGAGHYSVGASGHVKVPLYADYQINLGPFTSDTTCMPDPPTNKSIRGCKVLAKVENIATHADRLAGGNLPKKLHANVSFGATPYVNFSVGSNIEVSANWNPGQKTITATFGTSEEILGLEVGVDDVRFDLDVDTGSTFFDKIMDNMFVQIERSLTQIYSDKSKLMTAVNSLIEQAINKALGMLKDLSFTIHYNQEHTAEELAAWPADNETPLLLA